MLSFCRSRKLQEVFILREIDKMAVQAANDENILSDFIRRNELFILKTASKTAKHFISKNDDEWSIALAAFYDSVKKYQYDRGSFIPFAELLIRQNLVDYYRVQGRRSAETPVERIEEEAIVEQNDRSLKWEIEAMTQVLLEYGFSFMELADCSPKAGKTKKACAKAVSYILNNSIMINEIRILKQLPAKIIEKKAGVPRKILERHRKYIIAAVEILHGDYPYLSEYLNYIREEDLK